MVRLGLISPIVTRVPGRHGAWEETAGHEELAVVAQRAEELGYHHMTCSEHVAVPTDVASVRGGTYWDPLPTFGYLAARTQAIKLVTQVLVLGYHHPLAIAKRYGTLDRITGGRLVLGVGVGSLEEEFELLGASFTDRGIRADESMRALRSVLSRKTPEFRGTYFSIGDVVVDPHAVQPEVPLWVGGRTERSLRRAMELGNGWVPFALSPSDLRSLLAKVVLAPDFEVVLAAQGPLDPVKAPESARAQLAELRGSGATIINCWLNAPTLDEYLEALDALAALAATIE